MPITTYYAIVLSFSALVAIAVGFLAWRRRSVPGGIYFSLMMLAVAEWSIAAAIEAASVAQGTKVIWSQISYVGVSAAPTLFLLFSLKYWRPDIQTRRLYLICIWLFPAVTILIAATNGLHHLLWNSFTPESPDTNVLLYGHAIWFYINVAYSYLLMLVGVVILFRAVLSHPQLQRRQALVILIAAVLPWVGNVVYVSGFDPIAGLDLAPMAFSVTGLVLTFGIVKLQLLRIVPLARELLFQRMSNGVLVVDDSGHIVDFNLAAAQIIGRKIAVGQRMEEVLEEWSQIISKADDAQGVKEIFLANMETPRWIEVRITSLYTSSDKPSGRLIMLQDITERKKSHEALRGSEERFRQMVDLLPVAVCEIDISGNILFGNRAAFIMIGYDRADFEKGLNILPMIAPEDQERALMNIGRLIAGESLGADEYTLVRKDGSRFPATVHIANILDASGKTVGFRGIVVDITERRQAAEMQQRLAAIVESSHDAIIGKTLDGIITSWNKGAEERYGYSAAEAVGRQVSMLVPPDRVDEVSNFLETIGRGGAVIDFESERITKDGRRLTVLLTISPIKDASGKVVGASTIAQDVTERKRAEEALKKSEEQVRLLLNSTGEAIYGIDLHGNCTFANPSCIRMLGYTDQETMLGKHMHRLIHHSYPGGRPMPVEVCRIYQAFREGKGVHADDEVLWRADGSSFPAEYWSYPQIVSGEVYGAVVTFVDITERKRSEEIIRIRLSLLDFSATHSLEELLQKTLDEVGALTGSPIGFYHFVEKDQKTLSLQAWSTRTVKEFCKAEGQGMHYGIDKAGVWVDCVRQRRPVIHNDYLSLSHRKGLPTGHAVVVRELVVPIMRGGNVVAILGVGNKPMDYTDKDVEAVSYLADVAWEITERKSAQETLQKSEEKLRLTFESIADGIIIIDLQGNIVEVNDATVHIGGYANKSQLIGMDAFDLIAPKDRKMVMDDLKDRLAGHPKDRMEYSIYPKGGRSFEAELTASTLHDESGNPIGYIAVVRDITARKRAEEALLKSEKKFRTLFEDSIDAVVISTVSGKILDCNDSMLTLTGYGREELLSMNAIKLYANPADREMFAREIEATGSVKEYSVKWVKKDGTGIDVVMTLSARRDEDGKVIGYQGIVRDVTERKRLEASLQRSEKRFRELADFLPQTICEIDLNGRFTYANRYGIEAHGYTKEEIEKSLNAVDLFIPAQRDRVLQNISRVLSGQKFDDHEYSVLRKDGSTYPALLYTNAIVRNGQVAGVRALVVDITERKKIEQMKTDFVSFISHQLRTPVAGLMAYIDNMLDGVTGTLNDMQVDYLREMHGVCERNNRLIADLLNISRLERGVLAVNINPVDLRSAVDIAVKEHRKTIEEKGLALNLSGVDRETIVLADTDKLVEVLKNVIHNATKFTSKGSINIEIVASGQQGIVKISDTGMGLSKSALQDLFKKERVFGGAMAVGGGSGLGLYIAKGFMQLQHGDITAESVEGKGSTFIITLPRK